MTVVDASEAWKTVEQASDILAARIGCSRPHALFLINRRAHYGSGRIEEVAAGIIARSGLV